MNTSEFIVGQIIEYNGQERVITAVFNNGVFIKDSEKFIFNKIVKPAEPRTGDTVIVLKISPEDPTPEFIAGDEVVAKQINPATTEKYHGYHFLTSERAERGTFCKVALLRRAPSVSDGDRLFDEGCCFCGKAQCGKSMYNRSDGPHQGIRYGEGCWIALGTPLSAEFDAEVTRRKSLQPKASTGEKWEKFVVDRVVEQLSPKPDPYRVATIQQCMHKNADLMRGECPDCGASSMAAAEASATTKVGWLQWSDKQDERFKQTLSDLDRPVVRGMHDWDVDDTEELRCT
jgi:hypothetical protein